MADHQIDLGRIDEAVLAMMFLTLHKDRKSEPWRTSKSFDWGAMGRLHEKDLIFELVGKAKSVVLWIGVESGTPAVSDATAFNLLKSMG
jgi:hypothetical protein